MTAPSLPPLPPRSATEIIDGAVQLIRPHFGYFLRIAAVGAIPALLGSIASLLMNRVPATDPTALLRQQTQGLPLLMALLAYVFAALQSGAIVTGSLAVLRGDPLPTVWAAFLSALRRLHAIIGVYLLLIIMLSIAMIPIFLVAAGVAMVAGSSLVPAAGSSSGNMVTGAVFIILILFFFAFVGFTLFAQWVLMTTLVVIERVGPFDALRRAQALSKGNYGLLAKTYGLVMVIMMVIVSVMVFFALSFRDQQQLVQSIFSVIFIPIAPIVGSIGLVTYADLRIRREGADLDAALDALSTTPVLQG